ncbi:cell division protein PerM [Catenulispora subtropica]|uniref:Integral membrane protein n=1 Tax=Catenulispora subtropica TaxID=450798 RepID=A0ABP5DBU2_9ACTN
MAAARAASEPSSPPSVAEAFRDLAADWADAMTVAWNGSHGRDLRLVVRAGAHAALAAVATWLVAVTVCVVVWLVSAPNTAGVWGPLRVAGQLWLLGHHVALDVPAGRVAMAPLGFTALLLFALWHTTAAPVVRPVQVAYTAFGAATGYGLVAAVVAAGAATADVHPDTAQAVPFAVLFGALVPTAARWRRIAAFCVLPRWVVTAARAAGVAGAVLIGGSAAALAGALAGHLPEAGWPQGIGDACGMLLLSLAVLPNAVLWATAFVLGPGFAAGTGTAVNVLNVKTGALPLFPLLGALPRSGSHLYPYGLAFLAVPVVAGVAAALVVTRARHRRLGDRVRATGAASAAVALTVGLAATLSGGPLAGGRMAAFGPSGWRTAAATLVLVGVGAAAVVLLPPSALAVRRLCVRRLSVRRLLDAVAVLVPRRRAAEVGPGLAAPGEDDRQEVGHQGEEPEDLADREDPAGTEVGQAAQHADAEEDDAEEDEEITGHDAGVVVAGEAGEGHPEPEAGADQAADSDQAADDDADDEDVPVVVDGAVDVADADADGD